MTRCATRDTIEASRPHRSSPAGRSARPSPGSPLADTNHGYNAARFAYMYLTCTLHDRQRHHQTRESCAISAVGRASGEARACVRRDAYPTQLLPITGARPRLPPAAGQPQGRRGSWRASFTAESTTITLTPSTRIAYSYVLDLRAPSSPRLAPHRTTHCSACGGSGGPSSFGRLNQTFSR